MSRRYYPGQFPKRCTCGLRIFQNARQWQALKLVGTSDVPADPDDKETPEAYKLEQRNCVCGTTLGVKVRS